MRAVRASLGLLSEARGRSLRSQMIRGTGGTLVLKAGNTCLMLLISLVLARALGAAGYGAYAYTLSWVSLLVIPATLGFNRLLTREVARNRVTEDWAAMRGILRWSDRLALLLSSVIAVAGAAGFWFWRQHWDPMVVSCLLAGMALLPFMAILQLRAGASRGLGQVVAAQVPMMLVLPGGFLLAVLLVQLLADLTAFDAVILRIVTVAIAMIAAVMLLHRFLPRQEREAVPKYNKRVWLKSAAPFLFLAASDVVNQQIGVIMLGTLSSAEAAGVYDIARRAATLVGLVLLAVNMPLGPVVASLYARGELERLQSVVIKSAQIAAAGSGVIALVMIGLGPWVLGLFGSEFTAGLPVLVILCVGQILNAAAGSVALVLSMTGHERDSAKGIGIAAVAHVAFNAALIPQWGILGAAIGQAASTVLWNGLLIYWVWRRLGLRATMFGSVARRH